MIWNLLNAIRRLVNAGVDPGGIACPSGVSRRDFLKACGITAVSVSVPATSLWLPESRGRIVSPRFSKDSDELRDVDILAINETLFKKLVANPVEQEVIDAVNDFSRSKIREDGFYRRLVPPQPVTADGKAISIPFAQLPVNVHIHGRQKPSVTDRRLS